VFRSPFHPVGSGSPSGTDRSAAGARPAILEQEIHVLKKLGIIVGGTAAVLLAASPLAFADTSRSPECTITEAADNSIAQEGEGGDSLLGLAGGAVANTGAVTNTQTQAPALNCNNIEDVIDTTVEDNDRDNDETTTIEGSYNTQD
jgi:hypothetical protein